MRLSARRVMPVVLLAVVAGAAALALAPRTGSRGTDQRVQRIIVDVGARKVVAVARAGGDRWPSYSDGVLLTSVEGSGHAFAVRDADGRRIAGGPLTRHADPAFSPVLAPDRRTLAYVAYPDDQQHIAYGSLVVGHRRVLARALSTPAFSPDGRRVAVLQAQQRYVSEAPAEWARPARLVVVPVHGRGRPEVVARDLPSGPTSPRWLADGRLAYAGRQGLVLRSASGARTVLVPSLRVEDFTPSPEASHLALSVRAGGELRFLVADAAGHLHHPDLDGTPDYAWSPTGDRLAATSGDHIAILTPDGTHLADLPSAGGRELHTLTWSADGHRLTSIAAPPSPPGR
ncbi:MAG: tolB [Conexibacter sp.]|nr:tolB [Conexibacter sp.]